MLFVLIFFPSQYVSHAHCALGIVCCPAGYVSILICLGSGFGWNFDELRQNPWALYPRHAQPAHSHFQPVTRIFTQILSDTLQNSKVAGASAYSDPGFSSVCQT